jgi:hypothetical protein
MQKCQGALGYAFDKVRVTETQSMSQEQSSTIYIFNGVDLASARLAIMIRQKNRNSYY